MRKAFVVLLVIALVGATIGAFAGVEPFSEIKARAEDSFIVAKDAVVEFFANPSPPVTTTATLPPTPTTTPPPPTTTLSATPTTTLTEVEPTAPEVDNLFFILVNEKRIENGLQPLQESSLLEELAIEHSENMALTGHFAHERLGWRDFSFGMSPGTIRGENLSLTPMQRYIPGPFLSSEEVVAWAVDGLLASPGHRLNMLNKSFTHTGIGVAKSNGYFYITQIFEG